MHEHVHIYIFTDQEIDRDQKMIKIVSLTLFEKSDNFRAYHIHNVVILSRTSRILRKSEKF